MFRRAKKTPDVKWNENFTGFTSVVVGRGFKFYANSLGRRGFAFQYWIIFTSQFMHSNIRDILRLEATDKTYIFFYYTEWDKKNPLERV